MDKKGQRKKALSKSRASLSRVERGFTLIELIVVIVVIAILATISVVAYRGIQARAITAAYASAATQAHKQLIMALTEDPTIFSDDVACLGDITDYPQTGVFEHGECYVTELNGNRMAFSVSEIENNKLSAALGQQIQMPSRIKPIRITDPSGPVVWVRGMYVAKWFDNQYFLNWGAPDSSSCASGHGSLGSTRQEAIEALEQLGVSIGDLQAILQGEKTIEDVFGPGFGIDLEEISMIHEIVSTTSNMCQVAIQM